VCLIRLNYSTGKPHLFSAILDCHLSLYHILPNYFIQVTIFGKQVAPVFPRNLFPSDTAIIPRRIVRDMITDAGRSSCKVPVIDVRFVWHCVKRGEA
jgi:hypothetical protein